MDRSNAESMQQSLQQQLEQQRRAYEKLKADSSQRDREQQDQIQDLHLRVVNEQEEKVGSGSPARLPTSTCLVLSAGCRHSLWMTATACCWGLCMPAFIWQPLHCTPLPGPLELIPESTRTAHHRS